MCYMSLVGFSPEIVCWKTRQREAHKELHTIQSEKWFHEIDVILISIINLKKERKVSRITQ